jgi:hypothetical protein
MKKMVYAATIAALFTANVQADTVGLYFGGQIWQSEASGTFGENNTLIDFNLKKEKQNNYFVAFEHPFPFLPNVRISSTTLDTGGKTSLTQDFSFGDENFTNGADVYASFNVRYVDYTLYYQVLDNPLFSFNFGVTARDFNGAVTVAGTTVTDTSIGILPDTEGAQEAEHFTPITTSVTPTGKIKTNDIVPMLHVATNISLPLTSLSAFVQGDFSLIGDHSLYEYQVGLSYDLVDSKMVDFNLTLGYKAVNMKLEDLDNLYTDLEFKGAFVGAIAHF